MPNIRVCLVAVACAASATLPAAASDAPLQRALSQAACPGARLERLASQESTTIYRAFCSGSLHRRLVMTCFKDTCRTMPERERSAE
jgi:hypothetical protein